MKNQWLYTIDLPISGEETWESINLLVKSTISKLENIIFKLEMSKIEEKDYLIDSLQTVKEDFEYRGDDEGDENMDIQDSLEEVNYTLSNLYDIADLKVTLNGEKRKFIWINNTKV